MRFRFRLIPVTIVATTLVGGIKLGQVCSGAAAFFGVPAAVAKTGGTGQPAPVTPPQNGGPVPLLPAAATTPATAAATPSADTPSASSPAADPPTAGTKAAADNQAADERAPKSFNNPTQFSRADISLLQDLTKRRRELDRREHALDLREKLLVALSKRLNAKIGEMKALQASLKTLLAQRQAVHDKRIKSLVEVYQNMKPKDAARIFSRLEMPILLQVVSKMSENKLAPILAAMDPAKVEVITTDLATERGPATGGRTSGGTGAATGAGAPNSG